MREGKHKDDVCLPEGTFSVKYEEELIEEGTHLCMNCGSEMSGSIQVEVVEAFDVEAEEQVFKGTRLWSKVVEEIEVTVNSERLCPACLAELARSLE